MKLKNSVCIMITFVFLLVSHEAKADSATITVNGETVTISEPACANGANDALAKGDYCIDKNGRLSIFVKENTTEGFLGTGIGDTEQVKVKSRYLDKKELLAFANGYFGGQIDADDKGKTKVCSDHSGCATQQTVEIEKPKKDKDSDNGGKNVVVRGDDDGNRGNGNNRGNNSNRGNDRGSRNADRDSDRDVGARAQDDFDAIKDFCGRVSDDIQARGNEVSDKQDQLKNGNLKDLQEAEKKAYAAMLVSCRRDCLELAITDGGVCAVSAQKIAESVSKDDLSDGLLHLDTYFSGQNDFVKYINNVNSIDKKLMCSKMLANSDCKDEVKTSGISDCDAAKGWTDALADLNTEKDKEKSIQADIDTYNKNTTDRNCTITSAANPLISRPDYENSVSTRCLEKAYDSCPRALADAEDHYNATRPYCATCAMNGQNGGGNGGGSCAYGGCVSKAAQIIAALGGPVSSIAGGLMNMSMFDKSLSACTNSVSQCSAMYSQQITMSQAVGLPPLASSCGGCGGMGSGFSGMGAGLGGYNPMMMGGMGGMGGGMMGAYNPMMGGMGGMGMGYNPMMMGGMGGMGGGMMGAYNPMMGGMGGISGGLNFGTNPMMMGGMGMSYNPMMMGGMGGMGSYNPMMMGGMGGMGSYNPMMMGGMGGMGSYNPMMMGGMGGMGSYNPMMMGGMGSSPMMGVGNQMMGAQSSMQQAAIQQMAVSNSMMGGYNNGSSMYGMNNMYQSPMYGMGYNPMASMYSSYNPMMSNMYGGGMYGGYGGYNPYGSGISGGINFNYSH